MKPSNETIIVAYKEVTNKNEHRSTIERVLTYLTMVLNILFKLLCCYKTLR
jgi:hypothetical protein